MSLNLKWQPAAGKRFGLVKPQGRPGGGAKPAFGAAAFGSAADDDDDAGGGTRAVNRTLQGARAAQEAKARKLHDDALAQDASVFDYDGVYDELSAQKAGRINRSGAQHGGAGSANARPAARYVGQLKQAAAVREIEQDRIYERVQLKERMKDDALYLSLIHI